VWPLLDGETVITGSFNFTKSAEIRNAENLVIIHDPVLAAQYLQNWNVQAHSTAIGAVGTMRSRTLKKGTMPNRQVIGNRRSRIYAWPE
jgi:phosphatidylserine/phosphatidylglycerophosphate/cardiolipin synthase-like enzyme